jgi:hypothetical protein
MSSIENAKREFFNEQRIIQAEYDKTKIHDLRRAAMAALKLVPKDKLVWLLKDQPELITLTWFAIKRFEWKE